MLQEQFDSSEAEYNVIINLLQKILSARWFIRAWCSHEIKIRSSVKEKSLRVLLFESKKKVLTFEHRWIYIFTYFLAFVDKRMSNMMNNISSSLKSLVFRCIQVIDGSESLTSIFLTGLYETFGCNIELEVDRISIAMNLSRLDFFYKGSSSSGNWCFWICTALSLTADDMSSLTLRGLKLRIQGDKDSFVSWAQRPRSDEGRVTVKNTSDLIDITPKSIELDLFLIYSVSKTSSSDRVRLAEFIINRFSINVESDDIFFQRSHLYGHKWLINALASSLNCGLDWIPQFTRLSQEHLDTEEWTFDNLSQPNSRLENATLKMLFIFSIFIDQIAGFREQYLNPVIEFLTFLIHERFKKLTNLSRRIFADVKSEYAFISQIMTSFWFAVSTSLTETTCFRNQVWLLESYNSEIDEAVSEKISEHLFDTTDDIHKFFLSNREKISSSVELKHLFRTSQQEEESLSENVLTFDDDVDRAEFNDNDSWRLMTKTNLVDCLLLISNDENAVRLLKRQRIYE